jgi:hypothetical protein
MYQAKPNDAKFSNNSFTSKVLPRTITKHEAESNPATEKGCEGRYNVSI